jgi:hypothetical protein
MKRVLALASAIGVSVACGSRGDSEYSLDVGGDDGGGPGFVGSDAAASPALDAYIEHDGVDLATGSINVNGGGNTFATAPSVTVVAGDTIDFAVGYGGNGDSNDSTSPECHRVQWEPWRRRAVAAATSRGP